jgi:hypothetical protein
MSVPNRDGEAWLISGTVRIDLRLGFLRFSDPQTFTTVALLLIIAMVVTNGISESSFYRSAILERESTLVSDMAKASILQDEREEALSPRTWSITPRVPRRLTWSTASRSSRTFPDLPGSNNRDAKIADQLLPFRAARELFYRDYFANLLSAAKGNLSYAARQSRMSAQSLGPISMACMKL